MPRAAPIVRRITPVPVDRKSCGGSQSSGSRSNRNRCRCQTALLLTEWLSVCIVGNSSLTGLGKVCPSVGVISSNRSTPQYRETKELRCVIRVGKTLGSRDAVGGLVLAFDLSQLITQARSYGAILFGFDTELDGTHAAHRVDQLGDGTALAVAGMLELVDE